MRPRPGPLWIFCLWWTVAACSQTMTGRRQLTLIDDAEMNAMGVATFSELKREGKLSDDLMLNAYVECIVTALVEVVPPGAGPHTGPWEALVFDESSPNAFALPGGKIGVHSGMLELAVTPGQLAAVLGHEMAHVLLRHGNERMSQRIIADRAIRAGAVVAGVAAPDYQRAVIGGIGMGAQYGVLLPFSRKHENEADTIGQMFMARAGFYPAEAIVLWQRMAELGGPSTAQWKSTHPSDETRIDRLHQSLPRAMVAYERARANGKDPRCVPPVVYE